MIMGKKLIVVMPAYNAAKTIELTCREVQKLGIVDLIIIVDDASKDETVTLASKIDGVKLFVHNKNMGYGANQKTCYRLALKEGADIVVMLHPDYQYTPLLIPAMANIIASGLYHCVLGSRILGGKAIEGGMPVWKYIFNRGLTFFENLVLRAKLSEYHTGYRAFSRYILEQLPFEHNSNDFVFDNQILAEIIWMGYVIAEITCPTRYASDSSSINFKRSVKYGIGCIATSLEFLLADLSLINSVRFPKTKRNIARRGME